MPKLPKPPEPKTMDYLFSKTLNGVPTPWFGTGWIEGGREVQVRLRLWVRRRGRTLHVETHKDSPSYPGLRKPVSLQRQGMYALYTAGMKLVRLAKRDPTSVPAHPRYVWDRSDPEFLQSKELATAVCTDLHRLLNPKRGRPRREQPSLATKPGHPFGMRAARRKELLAYLQKMLDATEPMIDRVHDMRRMRGYDKNQRDEIAGMLNTLYRSVKTLRSAVFNDKFECDAPPMTTDDVLGIAPVAEDSATHMPPTSDTLTFELPNV